MTANLTQMPIEDEFVRAYAGHDGEKLSHVSLYPLHPFRVEALPLGRVVKEAMDEANKLFDQENPNTGDCNGVLNQRINDGIARLDREGKVIRGPRLDTGVVINELQPLSDGNNMVYSCDGYAVFNPIYLPPVANSYTQ